MNSRIQVAKKIARPFCATIASNMVSGLPRPIAVQISARLAIQVPGWIFSMNEPPTSA